MFGTKKLKTEITNLKNEKSKLEMLIIKMVETIFKNKHYSMLNNYEDASDRYASLTAAFTPNNSTDNFLTKFKKFIMDIFDVIKSQETKIVELEETLKSHECCAEETCDCEAVLKYDTIDRSLFRTKKYLDLFDDFGCSEDDKETLINFNNCLNNEEQYVAGIYDLLHFINVERNKKISTEKQIRKNILTEKGNEDFDKLYVG